MGAEYDQLHQKEIAHGRARYRGKPAVSHDGVSLRSFFILYTDAEATPVNRGAAHRPDVMFKTAADPRFGYAALLLCGVNGFYSLTTAIIGLSVMRARLCACVITLGSFYVKNTCRGGMLAYY